MNVARAEIRLPKIGLVMDNTKVVRWRKAVGDAVAIGEPLLELETEKSIVEVESTLGGTLAEIVCPPESTASVGDLLGWMTVADAAAPTTAVSPGPAASPSTPRADVPAPSPITPERPATPLAATSRRIRSSPAARRLAADCGVDLATVTGTGPNGRVQMADIARTANAAVAPPTGLSPMRRAVARAMTLSATTIPQFSLDTTVDLAAILAHRSRQAAPRPSVTDYLMFALGQTLPTFPAANAVFVGSPEDPDARIDAVNGVHVSLVVAVPDGLQLVTVHGVDGMSLAQVTQRRLAAVARARDGRLQRDDLTTGNVGLSNLGPNGPERFNAMLSPSQSSILAIGREREALVVRDGAILIRRVMTVTLTVDHRVIDGRVAADVLAALTRCLESAASYA